MDERGGREEVEGDTSQQSRAVSWFMATDSPATVAFSPFSGKGAKAQV